MLRVRGPRLIPYDRAWASGRGGSGFGPLNRAQPERMDAMSMKTCDKCGALIDEDAHPEYWRYELEGDWNGSTPFICFDCYDGEGEA